MRVTLDLLPSATDHVAGTLLTDTARAPVPFDGWLELMRLLEAVRCNPSDPALLGGSPSPSLAAPPSGPGESIEPPCSLGSCQMQRLRSRESDRPLGVVQSNHFSACVVL
jgi:hypothetical protein